MKSMVSMPRWRNGTPQDVQSSRAGRKRILASTPLGQSSGQYGQRKDIRKTIHGRLMGWNCCKVRCVDIV